MDTLKFFCAFSPSPKFFWKSKWQIQELVDTLSFLCAFSTRRRIFRTSNWQIWDLVVTRSFLCGFSPPPPVLIGNQRGKSRSWWAPSTFGVLFHPSLHVFGNRSGKSRSWCALSTFFPLYHTPLPQVSLEIEVASPGVGGQPSALCVPFHSTPNLLQIKVANPGLDWHPELCVGLFTPPP